MTMPDTTFITNWMNTTLPTYFMDRTTLPAFWMNNMTWVTPPSPMDPKVDLTPFAVFYFLTGATFFLGTACMMLPRYNDRALDGIATMSDFTKTSLRRQLDDDDTGRPFSRELRSLVHENGMEFDEFVNRMMGTIKRNRRPVSLS